MVIGTCRICLFLHGIHSLKGKRSILKRILERTKNTFNVSIAEVDHHDLWQRAALGVAMVSNDRDHVHTTLTKVVDFIDRLHVAEIIDFKLEIL